MKQRFNPDRQGASHLLERSDIAIVRGTPLCAPDGNLHDNRIRISASGFVERALWIDCPSDATDGIRSEFHRWTSQLTKTKLDQIVLALDNLKHTIELDVSQFSNDTILTIRHWDVDRERTSFVLYGHDQYADRIIPIENEGWFRNAWNIIQDSIPGQVSCWIDDPSEQTDSPNNPC